MKMIPLDKQSKRSRRAYYASKRASWKGISPVTRIVRSRKGYDRNRIRQEDLRSFGKWPKRTERKFRQKDPSSGSCLPMRDLLFFMHLTAGIS